LRLDNFDPDADDLRQLAEARLNGLVDGYAGADFTTPGREGLAEVVHELRVHQIELEMQNEELRRAQLELETSRERYEELFRLAPVGYITLNEKGIVGDANSTATGLLNVTRQTLLGQPFSPFIYAADRVAYYRTLELLVRSEGRQSADLRLQPLHAEPLWVHLEASPQSSTSGELLCFAVTLNDISERIQAETQIRQQNQDLSRLNALLEAEAVSLTEANAAILRIASMDELTGLANRRHFHEFLYKAISLARSHDSPLAVASFDLDSLKEVNDGEGHRAGDEVLSIFADLLGAVCRTEDLPARLGGDEFCLLLPGIELLSAHELGERVLAAVRSNDALRQRNVTVSGGIAQWVSDEPADELLRRAGQALYAAKHRGGDSLSTAE